jgi:hypothetical protein
VCLPTQTHKGQKTIVREILNLLIINYLEIELINLKHNYLKICVQNYLYYRKWHNLQIRTQIRQAQMTGMS